MTPMTDSDSKRLEEIERVIRREYTHVPESMQWLISKLRQSWADLAKARAALEELVTNCTHDEQDKNYRSLGDTYGWCSLCGAKVGYKENIARECLAKLDGGEK